MPPIRAASTLLFGAGMLLAASAVALAISIPFVPREGFGDLAAAVGAMSLMLAAGVAFAGSLLLGHVAPPAPARWRRVVAAAGSATGVVVAIVFARVAMESVNVALLSVLALASIVCLGGFWAALAMARKGNGTSN